MNVWHAIIVCISLAFVAEVSSRPACAQLNSPNLQCNDPYADVDGDGDVDSEDYGRLQTCFTGSDLAILPDRLAECGCFDRPSTGQPSGDGHVDAYDLQRFEQCASGPAIPADPACDDLPIPELLDITLSTLAARDGQTLQIGYQVSCIQSQEVQLICSMLSADNRPIVDTWNDVSILLAEGTQWYYRDFAINLPPGGPTGAYDVRWELRRSSDTLQTQDRLDYVTILSSIPIRVPILMYHYFGPIAYDDFWVETDQFRQQMQVLKAYGYTTLFMQDLMDIRAGVASLPAKPIMIMIDDGIDNQITEAFPILADPDINFKATSFIIAGIMGVPDPRYSTMTWDQARTLQLSGHIDIQSHSLTHPHLPEITTEELSVELVQSRQLIETELGKPVRFLCYPYGETNAAVKDALWQAGYMAAPIAGGGVETNCADKYGIRRVFLHRYVTLNYYHDQPQLFFMNVINDPLPIPNIQVQTISMLDPVTGEPLASVSRGRQVRIRVPVVNSGLAADVIASISMSTAGISYDSHDGDAMLADITVTFNPGEQEFEWTWQVPVDAPTGAYDARITYHDLPYLLQWHSLTWPGLINVTEPPP